MSEPVDISAARFRRASFSAEIKPRDVLAGVIADIDAGIVSPDHVIIVMRMGKDFSDEVHWAQAGPDNTLRQVGLLARASFLMQLHKHD